MKVTAVIPAYNEAEAVGLVIDRIKKKVDEVIVVDDGSSDKTYDIAGRHGAFVLRHFLNRGQGAALQTGINTALKRSADFIVTFDSDGQHDENDIEKMIQIINQKKVDVVLGSRFLDIKSSGMPFRKKILLKTAVIFTRLTTGLEVTDTHNGLRVFTAKGASKIQIYQDGMAHASEILEQISDKGVAYTECAVKITYSDYSKAKGQKMTNAFKIVWDLFLGRLNK